MCVTSDADVDGRWLFYNRYIDAVVLAIEHSEMHEYFSMIKAWMLSPS